MLNLNTQFDLIRQSATVAMADRILALKASGKTSSACRSATPILEHHPPWWLPRSKPCRRADPLRSITRLPDLRKLLQKNCAAMKA
jgi:hypothetical protein